MRFIDDPSRCTVLHQDVSKPVCSESLTDSRVLMHAQNHIEPHARPLVCFHELQEMNPVALVEAADNEMVMFRLISANIVGNT